MKHCCTLNKKIATLISDIENFNCGGFSLQMLYVAKMHYFTNYQVKSLLK